MHVINIRKEPDVVAAVKKLNGGKGVDYVVECSAAPSAVNDAVRMVNRGGKVCLAAFAHEEVPVDVAHIVRNNIYVYGIRGEGKSATHRAEAFMKQKRFDATKIHTHTFPLDDLPTAIRYAKDRVEDAIKVVVKAKMDSCAQSSGGVTLTVPFGRAERRFRGTPNADLRRLHHAGLASRGLCRDGGASRAISHRFRRDRYASLGARGTGGECAYPGADRRRENPGIARNIRR